MSRAIKVGFFISFALNFLFIGILLGRWTRPHMMDHFDHHMVRIRPEDMNKLPPEKQNELQEAEEKIRKMHEDMGPHMQKLRGELGDILEAKDFDEKAFTKKSKELDDLFAQSKIQMLENTKTLAKHFSQDERKVLSEFLRLPPPPSMAGPPEKP